MGTPCLPLRYTLKNSALCVPTNQCLRGFVRERKEAAMSELREDLRHPFQCERGREGECNHFYSWLGGQMKCLLKEGDPMHINGPHLLTASNGDQAYCNGDPRRCEFCAKDRTGGAMRTATVYEYDRQLRIGEIGVDFASENPNEEYTLRYDPTQPVEVEKMGRAIAEWVVPLLTTRVHAPK